MQPGDVAPVEGCTDLYYVETGMYDTTGYGAVYVIDSDHPALVESGIGTNADLLLDALSELGVAPGDLETIALTHVHLDHAGGAGYLARECPDATVYVHEAGAPHLVDPAALVAGTKRAVGDQWRHYADPVPVPDERIVALADGDAVPLGDRELVAHHCPGHAPHQVVFYDTLDEAVFTADAAGIWVAAREQARETTPPPQFDLEQCLGDVETIRALAPSALLFTHFGPGPDDVDGVLDRYRRRLVGWVEAVRQERARLEDDGTVAEHFGDEAVETVGRVWGTEKAREEAKLNVRGVVEHLDGRDA